MPDNKEKTDWIGALTSRARKAYKPTWGQTFWGPMGQSISQGMVGKMIGQQTFQETLKKTLMEAILKSGQITTVEGQPIDISSLKDMSSDDFLKGFKWDPVKVETTKPSTYKEKLLKNFIDTGEIPTSFKGKEKQFHKVIGTYVPPEKPVGEELPVDWKIWQQAIKESTDWATKEVDINLARKRYLELSKVFIPGRKPLPAPVEKPIEEYTVEELLKMQKELLGK